MHKYLLKLFPVFFALMFFITNGVYAQGSFKETKEGVFQFLQSAFDAQVSLSEKPRPKQEIEAILSPFFSEEYKATFLSENLVEENGKYLTYGSDFAPYYIPFYQFSNNTKVYFSEDKIYVYEYFEKNDDGPVTYEGHYEGLLLSKIKGKWKVSQLLYDNLPEEIIEQDQTEKSNKEEKEIAKAETQSVKSNEPMTQPQINTQITKKYTPLKLGFEEINKEVINHVIHAGASKVSFERLVKLEETQHKLVDPKQGSTFNSSQFNLGYEIKPFKLIHSSVYLWLEKRLSFLGKL